MEKNGKEPFCIALSKIEKRRKSRVEEIDLEGGDFLQNANFVPILASGYFPFRKCFFRKISIKILIPIINHYIKGEFV